MIRRDHPCPSGTAGWALISQVEHARLSGEMVAVWGSPACPPLEFPGQMLPAIEHHDDGWAVWEQQPGVDAATGRPLNFTEMPLDESLVIWQRSIDVAASFGPLAGWMVSGHFSALLRHQNAWQNTGSADHILARAFLEEADRQRAQWLGAWQAAGPKTATAEAAERALHWLQFFDALSLWLCTARRDRPHEMPLPAGGTLRLEPEPGEDLCPQSVKLAPWPFSRSELPLQIPARCVVQARYSSSAELAAATEVMVVLDWLLAPSH